MLLFRSRLASVLAVLSLLLGLLAAFPATTGAATFVVTNTNPSGPGSLAQAIEDTETSPGPDVITFDVPLPATITLNAALFVATPVTIIGPEPSLLTIKGNDSHRAFAVIGGGNLTLSGVGIVQSGIAVAGALKVKDTVFHLNHPGSDHGGAIENLGGVVSIRSSAFIENTHALAGGAIYNNGTMTIVNSTFYGNFAPEGGAIKHDGGSLTIVNSTIAANSASGAGGGVNNAGGHDLTIRGTLVVDNLATTAPDLYGDADLIEYSLFDDANALVDVTGVVSNTQVGVINPVVAAPVNFGGPTDTMPLISNLGVDVIPPGDCAVMTDQRGVIRPQNGACDVGAYEVYTGPNNLQACLHAGSLSRVSGIGSDFFPSPSLNCGRGQSIVLLSGKSPTSLTMALDLYACLYAGALSQVGTDVPDSCGRGTLVALGYGDAITACLYAGSLSQVRPFSPGACGRGTPVQFDRIDWNI